VSRLSASDTVVIFFQSHSQTFRSPPSTAIRHEWPTQGSQDTDTSPSQRSTLPVRVDETRYFAASLSLSLSLSLTHTHMFFHIVLILIVIFPFIITLSVEPAA
jgi:hypothetical protein